MLQGERKKSMHGSHLFCRYYNNSVERHGNLRAGFHNELFLVRSAGHVNVAVDVQEYVAWTSRK